MTIRLGTVSSFDVEVGLGEVDEATGERYPFHCTAIADGSRDIDAGQPVCFLVGPGGPGAWEAVSVVPLP